MPILLVEDDQDLAAGLKQALQHEGYAVNHVPTGREAIIAVQTALPDIVILDLGLPDMDGLEVLEALRTQQKDLPVLLLTARSHLNDRVSGLDKGADDYLAKPFDMEELFARLRVWKRRQSSTRSTQIRIGAVLLDTASSRAFIDQKEIELGRREYMLLKALMENAGRIQSKEALENKLYSWGEEISSNAIEVHIHNLRKKLVPDFIRTIRGIGYLVGQQ